MVVSRFLCLLVSLIAAMATLHCANASVKEFPDQDVWAKFIKSPNYIPSSASKAQSIATHDNTIGPNSCFHFFVSRNMSQLLSDSTKMLRQVRDRREREWLLTFIYRIKSLAEHLRSHPEARNYECLPVGDDEWKKSPNFGGELYFEDVPFSKRGSDSKASQKTDAGGLTESQGFTQLSKESGTDNQTSTESSATHTIMHEVQSPPTLATSTESGVSSDVSEQKKSKFTPNHETIPIEQNIVPEKWPENEEDDSLVKELHTGYQLNLTPNLKDASIDSLTLSPEGYEMYMKNNKQKETIQSILEDITLQVKKLRALGGTEADIQKVWKLSESEDENALMNDVPKRNHYPGHVEDDSTETQQSQTSNTAQSNLLIDEDEDFDDDEMGAAAGELQAEDRFLPKERTVAPSMGEVLNSKEQGTDSNTEQEDILFQDADEDVLVKQLEEERYKPANHYGTTRALIGPNGQPLTSTDSILIFD